MENSKTYKTLEIQIMDLWKSRGMDVDTITVHAEKNKSGGHNIFWTIKVIEKSK